MLSRHYLKDWDKVLLFCTNSELLPLILSISETTTVVDFFWPSSLETINP